MVTMHHIVASAYILHGNQGEIPIAAAHFLPLFRAGENLLGRGIVLGTPPDYIVHGVIGNGAEFNASYGANDRLPEPWCPAGAAWVVQAENPTIIGLVECSVLAKGDGTGIRVRAGQDGLLAAGTAVTGWDISIAAYDLCLKAGRRAQVTIHLRGVHMEDPCCIIDGLHRVKTQAPGIVQISLRISPNEYIIFIHGISGQGEVLAGLSPRVQINVVFRLEQGGGDHEGIRRSEQGKIGCIGRIAHGLNHVPGIHTNSKKPANFVIHNNRIPKISMRCK